MDQKTQQSTSIGLKPLTEGLGLNHFADGLPYTPASARKKPTIQFGYAPPAAPAPLKQAPVGTESAARMIERFEAEKDAEPVSAGFIRRVLAYGLDMLFSTVIFATIVWVSFTLNGFDVAHLLGGTRGAQMFWPLALLYVVVHAGYFLVQETTWRRTLGKAVFGMHIRAQSGFATLGRAVCFLVAVAPLGVGLLWCFFDARRRCWHDVITDSEVVLT
jgi:uncharacterized RDD family membrane protein YckC